MMGVYLLNESEIMIKNGQMSEQRANTCPERGRIALCGELHGGVWFCGRLAYL